MNRPPKTNPPSEPTLDEIPQQFRQRILELMAGNPVDLRPLDPVFRCAILRYSGYLLSKMLTRAEADAVIKVVNSVDLKDQWQESVVGDDEKPTAENSEQPLTV
jgi:hypothetical protein